MEGSPRCVVERKNLFKILLPCALLCMKDGVIIFGSAMLLLFDVIQ